MLRGFFFAHVASTALAARQNLKVEATSSVANVMDKISGLLEAHGANSEVLANLKLLTSQRITPGATDSLNEILTRVIGEIEANVESKIKTGHADTQKAINDSIADLQSATSQAVDRKSEADAADKAWSDCVRAEKAARVAVEEAEAALAKSRSNVNEPCQLQDDRAPYEWTPRAEQLKFVCDISQHGNCDEQMKNYRSQIGNMMGALRSDVSAKVASYTEAKQACDAAKADSVEKQDSRDAAVAAWEGQRRECLQKHEPRQVAMCLFGVSLQGKCGKFEAYRTLMAQIDEVKGGEYSHPDRVAEWKTTALTKCLLSKVVEGADVNEATLSACEQSVNFAYDVGVLDRKSQLFAELTSADKFTCAEQTITFTGETWEVPEGESPDSSEYIQKAFAPEVSLADGTPPFGFCKGGDQGGKDTEPEVQTTRVACEWRSHGTHRDCKMTRRGTCYGNVKYGHGDKWTEWREIFGDFDCSNREFGDPNQGQAKECICEEEVEVATEHKCWENGFRWMPLNMAGQSRTVSDTVKGCQERCASTTGCKHFSFWHDGGCHLQDGDASRHDHHAVSGPPSCDSSLAERPRKKRKIIRPRL